jgi:hypothetical protein
MWVFGVTFLASTRSIKRSWTSHSSFNLPLTLTLFPCNFPLPFRLALSLSSQSLVQFRRIVPPLSVCCLRHVFGHLFAFFSPSQSSPDFELSLTRPRVHYDSQASRTTCLCHFVHFNPHTDVCSAVPFTNTNRYY